MTCRADNVPMAHPVSLFSSSQCVDVSFHVTHDFCHTVTIDMSVFIKGVWLMPAWPFHIGQGATCASVSCLSFTRRACLSSALGTIIGEHNNVLLLGTLTNKIVSFFSATTFELEHRLSTMHPTHCSGLPWRWEREPSDGSRWVDNTAFWGL